MNVLCRCRKSSRPASDIASLVCGGRRIAPFRSCNYAPPRHAIARSRQDHHMLTASLAPLDETITIAELTRDPYPIYRRLRREAPVLRVKVRRPHLPHQGRRYQAREGQRGIVQLERSEHADGARLSRPYADAQGPRRAPQRAHGDDAGLDAEDDRSDWAPLYARTGRRLSRPVAARRDRRSVSRARRTAGRADSGACDGRSGRQRRRHAAMVADADRRRRQFRLDAGAVRSDRRRQCGDGHVYPRQRRTRAGRAGFLGARLSW